MLLLLLLMFYRLFNSAVSIIYNMTFENELFLNGDLRLTYDLVLVAGNVIGFFRKVSICVFADVCSSTRDARPLIKGEEDRRVGEIRGGRKKGFELFLSTLFILT